MAEPNLQEIHDFLFDIALKAGDMITSANPTTVDTKKNCTLNHFIRIEEFSLILHDTASDLVTETDKAVEDMVSSSLKSRFPDYSYVPRSSHSSYKNIAIEVPNVQFKG